MNAPTSEPPLPLVSYLETEIDESLRSAVDSGAAPLIEALQRASRYANISDPNEPPKVSYSRRVVMLGMIETALSGLSSDSLTRSFADWVKRVEPKIEAVLNEKDRSDEVRRVLESNRQIAISETLTGAIRRASAIARRTRGRDQIDLRHLLFAISEEPGRAFVNFSTPPKPVDLEQLRILIVRYVLAAAEPSENIKEWAALARDSNPSLKPLAEPDAEQGASSSAAYSSRSEANFAGEFDITSENDDGPVPPLAGEESPDTDELEAASEESPENDQKGIPSAAEPIDGETRASDKPAVSEAPRAEPVVEPATDFVLDDAEQDQDQLERSILAIGLGRRLHGIWLRTNTKAAASCDSRGAYEGGRAAFVVHLDAPWGGGKTTFANFLGRVLNPCPHGRLPAEFLRQRYGEADLGGIFLEDPPASDAPAERLKAKYPGDDERRPWIVVYFNAWQMEHIRPPWWAFYQAIRRTCFQAIRREGARPWDPTSRKRDRKSPWPERWGAWLSLWAKEFVWRVTNPKIYFLLLTALVSLALVGLLWWNGWWGIIHGKESDSAGFILANPAGLLLTGLGGITGLWGLGALITESIVPGTDTLAERLNLGSGDPFARFRRHFARTIERVRRPVLVIVDDLDRCEPEFVVDLIRGIQTLLRSPRVTFVILGDRDWIERAFEASHESMSKVDVGPEQTFGARFVEKAIQMSFILPALGDEARIGYVRHVVLGDRASVKRPQTAAIAPEAAARVREFVNREAARPEVSAFDSGPILDKLRQNLWERPVGDTGSPSLGTLLEEVGVGKDSAELEQFVSETLAIRAASDEQAEREVKHELEDFARFFPANPRQIKRIVNSITIYYSVAIQRPDIQADRTFRALLAAWIIIMTEWPQTWRLLASFPDLVDILNAPDPDKAMRRELVTLPGSIEATQKLLKEIRADGGLMALITGKDWQMSHPALEASQVRKLSQLTPLHSRIRRLAAEPEPEVAELILAPERLDLPLTTRPARAKPRGRKGGARGSRGK